MWLFIIDLIDVKITKKEKEDMREMLQEITKGKNEKGKINNNYDSEKNTSFLQLCNKEYKLILFYRIT